MDVMIDKINVALLKSLFTIADSYKANLRKLGRGETACLKIADTTMYATKRDTLVCPTEIEIRLEINNEKEASIIFNTKIFELMNKEINYMTYRDPVIIKNQEQQNYFVSILVSVGTI